MRIVIKPAGFITLLVMLSLLGAVAYLRNRPEAAPAAVSAPSQPVPPAPAASQNLLLNGGFEGEAETVIGTWPNSKGTATGRHGKGWLENSLWGDIQMEYALDPVNPHGGNVSQRVTIVRNKEGQAQFVQERPAIVGKTYRAAVWVRASEDNLPVTLMLRQAAEPYKQYKTFDATVGKKWQQLTVTASPTEAGNLFTMLSFKKAGASIWVDDAELVEVP